MAKSKAKKGKKNTTSKKATEKAVEAKLAKKEELAVEAEEVEKVDEEVVEEEIKDEEVEEVEDKDEDEVEVDDEDSEDEDEDDSEDDDDDSDEDDDDDSDDEDEEDESDEDDESEDEDEDEDEEDDEEDDEPEVKAKKSDKKSKKAVAAKELKKAEKAKKAKAEKKAEKTEPVKVIASTPKTSACKEFFARKFDASENILTIFTSGKIYGALIAELLGTAALTIMLLTLGLNPIYAVFAYLGITLATFKLSGANLNPIITAGMLATRRMSAIRGVLYFIAQVLGAWVGYLVVNAFLQAGIATGNVQASSTAIPALAAAGDITVATEGSSYFWAITMIEFIGAIVIAFAYARALAYKRNSLTFAITLSAGVFTAILFALTLTMNYLGISQEYTYVLNPASAVVYGLFPSNAEGFDALMQALMPMLVSYVIFPIIGGIVGFYVSDLAGKLSGEKLDEE